MFIPLLILACFRISSLEMAEREKDAALVCYDGHDLVFASQTTAKELRPMVEQYAADRKEWEEIRRRWYESLPKNQTDEERIDCIKRVMFLATLEVGRGLPKRKPQNECLPSQGSGEQIRLPPPPEYVEPEARGNNDWWFHDRDIEVHIKKTCYYRESVE